MEEKEDKGKKTRELSIKEGSFASVTAGVGDSYIIPYALELKADNLETSFVSSLASFLGPIAQIIGSRLIEKFHRKSVVVTSVIFQASVWLLIIALGFIFLKFGKTFYLIPLFIVAYTLYSFCGSLGGPAWFSMLGDVVPEKIRGSYFSRRNRISSLINISFTTLGAIWLFYTKKWELIIPGFLAMFVLAAASRYVSAFYLSRHEIGPLHLEKEYYFSFWQFIKKAPFNNFGRFTIYVAMMTLAINIAGPFFAIYMWKELAFNPIWFTLVNISSGIFSLLFIPLWGRFADRWGNRELLKLGSLLVIPGSLLWVFSPNPIYIALVPQLVMGIGWAAFSLAASNFIYDAVTPERRAICVAYYNVLNGAGVLIGASLGGFIAEYVNFSFINVFLFLFILSSLARLLVNVTLLPKIREVRQVYEPTKKNPLAYLKEFEPSYLLPEFFFYPINQMRLRLFIPRNEQKSPELEDPETLSTS